MSNTKRAFTQDLKQGDELMLAGQECVIIQPIIKDGEDYYTIHFAYIHSATYGSLIAPKNISFDVVPGNL